VSLLSPEEIAADRAMAEANLPDTCKIERAVVGRGAFNETTGQYANDDPSAPKTLIYQGPCKFQIRADINANIVEPVEVEREWAYQTSTMLTPIDATADGVVAGDPGHIGPDDFCTVLTSSYDASLPGRVFNIHSSFHKSLSSVRRFRVREAVR
jgi:hypothetical protein